jgi:hypothetical protein
MFFRRARAAVSVLALTLVFAGAAAAAPSDRERARALLADGSKAFDAGEYVQALRAFQDAYAILPSPKIHYNFGLTYAALGRFADALGAFERFVAEAPDAAPETLVEAREQITNLRRSVAYVEVTCNVAGAQVVVSGRSVGTTPLARGFPVDPGPHDLVVKKEGMPPDVREFTATAGGRLSFRVALIAAPQPRPAPPLLSTTPEPSRPWQTPAAWGTGIAGGLLIGGGVILELMASRQYREFNAMDGCGRADPMAGGPACKQLLDDADLKRLLGIGALVVGGAAAVTAISFAVWAHRLESAGDRRSACVPALAGVSCSIRF